MQLEIASSVLAATLVASNAFGRHGVLCEPGSVAVGKMTPGSLVSMAAVLCKMGRLPGWALIARSNLAGSLVWGGWTKAHRWVFAPGDERGGEKPELVFNDHPISSKDRGTANSSLHLGLLSKDRMKGAGLVWHWLPRRASERCLAGDLLRTGATWCEFGRFGVACGDLA
jgi:hypothetical protein